MRISTAEMYRVGTNNILLQQQNLLEIQSQLSSGKRVSQPSDDPVASARAVLIRNEISHTEQYQANINSSRGRLQQEEGLLNSMADNLQRIRELYIQMNSGALDTNARKIVLNEVGAQLVNLASLANFQDNSGQFIFAGFQSEIQPVTLNNAGSYVYNGDDGQQLLQISPSLQLPISDSGFQLFSNVPSGNGTFSILPQVAGNQGSGVISTGVVMDPSAYIAQDYTISFQMNANVLQYTVKDSQNNSIATGNYLSGSDIQFDGISVSISGTPAAGDAFDLSPSQGKSIFDSVQDVLTNCQNVALTSNGLADYQNILSQGLVELDSALNSVNQTRTQVGARLNTLDSCQSINEDFTFQSKTLLSLLEDLDMAQAAVDLSAQSAALQAAQQSFVKIQNLSVFNYL